MTSAQLYIAKLVKKSHEDLNGKSYRYDKPALPQSDIALTTPGVKQAIIWHVVNLGGEFLKTEEFQTDSVRAVKSAMVRATFYYNNLTISVLEEWMKRLEQYGILGLRDTKLRQYPVDNGFDLQP